MQVRMDNILIEILKKQDINSEKYKSMRTKICTAIKNKNLLEFTYKERTRIVEPHTLGINLKDNEVLSAYQIDGKSDSIEIPDWGLFTISKISNLKILNNTFDNPRFSEGFNRNSSRMKTIFCEL
jgi:predicted DNA-binding transcriptional regulator YafY